MMGNTKSQNEVRYDENVLKLLKQRIILAYILRYTVSEFAGMDIGDMVILCCQKYICPEK